MYCRCDLSIRIHRVVDFVLEPVLGVFRGQRDDLAEHKQGTHAAVGSMHSIVIMIILDSLFVFA